MGLVFEVEVVRATGAKKSKSNGALVHKLKKSAEGRGQIGFWKILGRHMRFMRIVVPSTLAANLKPQ